MFLPFVRTKFIYGLGRHLCRPSSILTSNVTSTTSPSIVCSSRWMSVEDKRGVVLGPKKKKQSEMTFSPLVPSDEFLERRKKSFVDKIASTEGQTNFSTNVLVGVMIALTVVTLAPVFWFRKKLVLFYEHPETIPKVKPPKTLKETLEAQKAETKFYVSQSNLALVDEVLSDMNLTEKLKKNLGCFTADTFDPIYYGSLTFKGGVYLGLPYYVEYTSVDQIDPEAVRHKPCFSVFTNQLRLSEIEETPENKEELDKLKQTFILSDKAKKFMMAQKLVASRSFFDYFANVAAAPFVTIVSGILMAQINSTLSMFSRPFHIRMALYSVFYSGIFLVFYISLSEQNGETDGFVDRQAYTLGKEYLEGAVEYYTKSVERGQLFRKLHPKGKFYFDEEGDPSKYFWQPPYAKQSRAVERLRAAREYLDENKVVEFGVSIADKIKLFQF